MAEGQAGLSTLKIIGAQIGGILGGEIIPRLTFDPSPTIEHSAAYAIGGALLGISTMAVGRHLSSRRSNF